MFGFLDYLFKFVQVRFLLFQLFVQFHNEALR